MVEIIDKIMDVYKLYESLLRNNHPIGLRLYRQLLFSDLHAGESDLLNSFYKKRAVAILLSITMGLLSGLITGNVLFSMFIAGFIYYYPELRILEKAKVNRRSLHRIKLKLIMKITLLMSAGFPGNIALKKVVENNQNPILVYIHTELSQFHNQKEYFKVILEIANRLDDVYISRAFRIILLDMKYGHKESLGMMIQLNDEMRISARTEIVKLAEGINNKLLIPMSMSLIGIVIALTIPAIIEITKVL